MVEVASFSKNSDCMLRVSSSSSVSDFRNAQFYQQLCEMCPHLVWALTAICKSGKPAAVGKNILSKQIKGEVDPKLRNAICAAAATCLHQYNQKPSGYHYRNGLMLLHGDVKAARLEKCDHLGLTVSQKSCIHMQSKLGDNFNEKVFSWTEQTKERELMIRFLEEAKGKLLVMEGDNVTEMTIDLSNDECRIFRFYKEVIQQKCTRLLREIREHDLRQVTVEVLQKAIDHLRGNHSFQVRTSLIHTPLKQIIVQFSKPKSLFMENNMHSRYNFD